MKHQSKATTDPPGESKHTNVRIEAAKLGTDDLKPQQSPSIFGMSSWIRVVQIASLILSISFFYTVWRRPMDKFGDDLADQKARSGGDVIKVEHIGFGVDANETARIREAAETHDREFIREYQRSKLGPDVVLPGPEEADRYVEQRREAIRDRVRKAREEHGFFISKSHLEHLEQRYETMLDEPR